MISAGGARPMTIIYIYFSYVEVQRIATCSPGPYLDLLQVTHDIVICIIYDIILI